jgi:hypothetical protein
MQSARGTRSVGDTLVGAAKDEYLHELLEDHPVGHPVAMAAERMIHLLEGSRAETCVQIGSMRYVGRAGTGFCSLFGKLE